ncbi:FtsX-like permease family protein [Spiroplasma endosymbiont of Labia minor]|uniref:FtsX-like permease family protein n=1 Tax=Spiroplasma endosymbiont of Labia minor TaxID=3066305 RepID=UPI0030CB9D8B
MLSTFIVLTERINVVLLIIMTIVFLIAIELVLLQNKAIIHMLKTLGYKMHEIAFQLLSGYIFSTIMSLIFAGIATYLLLAPLTIFYIKMFGYALIFVQSWQFYLILFGVAIGFIGLIFVSAQIMYNELKPRKITYILSE